MERKGRKGLAACLLGAFLVGSQAGCLGGLTGPNRLFRMVMNTQDFATFEGVVLAPCEDVKAVVGDSEPATVGCLMKVSVMGQDFSRSVFFPSGDLYNQALGIPQNARISVNARPMQTGTYEAHGVEWRRQ